MQLTLELKPEVIERLLLEAEASGQPIETYVSALIENHVKPAEADAEEEAAWGTPDYILAQAVQLMKENQIRNRDLAVEVITQKNYLQAEIAKEERIIAEMQRKANLATEDGNATLAEQFLKEKERHIRTLEKMRVNHITAIETVEKVKAAIMKEEESIRVRVTEALSLNALLRQAQMGMKVSAALDRLQLGDSETADALRAEWQAAFASWQDSLDPWIKEALERKPEGVLRRKVRALRHRRQRAGR